MPVVFRDGGFRFFFYSNEGDPREPVHVHVMRDQEEAKFCLYPVPSVAYNRGYNARVLANLLGPWRIDASRSKRLGMTTLARPTSVRFDDHSMWMGLDDGRRLGVPLAWFPRLLHGSPVEREKVTLSPSGLHWETLDEDVSITGLLAGRGDMTNTRSNAA